MWNDSPENVLILGHRGMRSIYPENTMVSFKGALDARVDLIEMDLHLTKDGVLVVCHDETVDRTTDGTGLIKEKTLAEIKELDAGIKKGLKFKGERIPTFREFLELVSSADYEVLLNVEIKSYTHETVDEAVKLLKEFGLFERSVIACFNAEIVRYTKRTYPDSKTQGFPERKLENFTEDTYDCMYGMGIPLDDEHAAEDVSIALSHGIKPWLYCSDTEEDVKRCVKYGTFNVTGNDPYPALEYLPKTGLHAPIYENRELKGKMKAANLYAPSDMRIEEVDIPECCEDEVLVEIKACGICGSDVDRVLTKGTYHFPTIPGHEFSGKVVYDKNGILVGKRVSVFPLLPCFKCDACADERFAQCSDYDYYGSRRDGGFAQYIAVKKYNLVELPHNVTYEEGAMCEPVSVALHAVKKLEVKGGETVLVTGAGPIGLIAGMWLKSFGAAKVCYTDIDERKLDFCKQLGFEPHDGSDVDLVLEGTGAQSAIAYAVNSVKAGGKIVLMGNPSKEIFMSAKDYQNILRKEIVLKGTWNSSYASYDNDWKESLEAISESKILLNDLITHKVSIDGCFDAIKMMAERKEFSCKVMVVNEK